MTEPTTTELEKTKPRSIEHSEDHDSRQFSEQKETEEREKKFEEGRQAKRGPSLDLSLAPSGSLH